MLIFPTTINLETLDFRTSAEVDIRTTVKKVLILTCVDRCFFKIRKVFRVRFNMLYSYGNVTD